MNKLNKENNNRKNIEYSIVIPVYNSERSLPELYLRLKNVFKKLDLDSKFEIIFVDDYSRDRSWKVLERINKGDDCVKIIRLMRNFGQHNALMCGFNYSSGNYVITIDDDLQNPPEEIPKLINKIKSSPVDVVTGTPLHKKHSLLRNIGSHILEKFFCIIFQKPKGLKFGSLFIIKKEIIQEMIKEKTPNPMLGALILKNTLNITAIKVKHLPRKYGRTNYSISKILSMAYDLLINHSTIPLKIMSIIGFMSSFLGFAGLVYIILKAIFGQFGVSGWASTVFLIFFFGGLILFSFGIMGEYLIRILQEVSNQSQFKIRKMYLNGKNDE